MKGAGIFKMGENNKEETNKVIGVGLDMLELIERIRKKFESEYGFKPPIVHITNLIARRVDENSLF